MKNPYENCNFFYKLFFVWTIGVLKTGSKLSFDNIPTCLKKDEASELGTRLLIAWKNEKKNSKLKKRSPKLYRSLLAVFGYKYFYQGLVLALNEIIIRVAQSVCLKYLIESLEENEAFSGEIYLHQFLFGGGLCLLSFIYTVINHSVMFRQQHIGMQCRVALTNIIYKKRLNFIGVTYDSMLSHKLALKLKSHQSKIGQLVNILSNDVAKFDTNLRLLNFFYIGPTQTIILVALLWREFGLSSLAGCGFIFILIPIQYYIGQAFLKSRKKVSNQIDTRSKMMFEAINSIKNIKIHCWENLVLTLINNTRKKELMLLKKITYLKALILSLYISTSKIVIFLTIYAYITFESETISPKKVFFAIIIFNIMRQVLVSFLPTAVASMSELKISTLRIETQLINLILGELEMDKGTLDINGKISVASQEQWIFNGTIRANITFGDEFNQEKYDAVINACALRNDFAQMEFGDRTRIGEQGFSISGGQKARICLARAIYSDANVYLIDDALSAVDGNVSNHIFRECLQNHLNGKLRILVTHQTQYLSFADWIILMKEGQILEQGTYQCVENTILEQNNNIYDLNAKEYGIFKLEESQDEKFSRNDDKENEIEEEKFIERTNSGSINKRDYATCLKSGKSVPLFVIIITVFLFNEILTISNDIVMENWINLGVDEFIFGMNKNALLYIFLALSLGVFLLSTIRSLLFFNFMLRISKNLHDSMITKVFGSLLEFFNLNTPGRILNRFTRDISAIDELLPAALFDFISIFLLIFGIFILIIIQNLYMTIPALIISAIFYIVRKFYVKTSRSLKRIETTARSPILSHLTTTLNGIKIIRCMKKVNHVIDEFENHQNQHTSVWFVHIGAGRWFALCLELSSVLFLSIVTFGFLILANNENQGSSIGLAITSAMTITGVLQWGMIQSAETENLMTSVERVIEYSKLKQEEQCHNCLNNELTSKWPTEGQIEFVNVNLSYGETNVLNNLCLNINGGEKIGIVGRTGAGKSSIVNALLRITWSTGDILIDKINTKNISLKILRKNISIIPQSPILFAGSLRTNLDPFNEYTDANIWTVLEEVGLKEFINTLNDEVEEGGTNFSAGQKQLICLSRAILSKNKIVILDEATANIDKLTELKIQTVLREKLKDSTTITIAHRLNTIINSDRVIYMENGFVKEFDSPQYLLSQSGSSFSKLFNNSF